MYESFTKLSTPVRLAYLGTAACVWVLTLGGRLLRGRVVVLCYHNVRPDQATRFEQQARMVASRTIPLAGTLDVPRMRKPRIVFTFDDAYVNLLATVVPVMRGLETPWSVFPVTGAMGTAPTWSIPDGHPDAAEHTMSRDQVRALSEDPLVEIGAHTRTHPSLAEVREPDKLKAELESPREELASLTNRPIETLALPHGSFDYRVLEAAANAGYARVLTLEDTLEPRGVRVQGAAVLGRFTCSPDIRMAEYRLLVDGAYCWLGGFRALMRRLKGAHS
jgi:peptidoglycan/xylan/chitin deacetylase (PgdA/CDA1 family)